MERVRCWSAKLLSYACGLQLIQAVLFGVKTYQAQVFIFLKIIMILINGICQTFLWTGDVASSKKALVYWEKVFLSSLISGINVIHMITWKRAAILKHLQALAAKKDYLWIYWVHIYYMKHMSVISCEVLRYANQVFRNIFEAWKYVMLTQNLQGGLK